MRPKDKRAKIFASYGFSCCCAACSGESNCKIKESVFMFPFPFPEVGWWDEKRENLRILLENQTVEKEVQKEVAR